MRVELLDHGYLQLVESWGSDERIIEAARMSTDGAFRGWGTRCKNCGLTVDEAAGGACDVLAGPQHDWHPGDEKLLRHLYTHSHATPFEMAGMIVEVQAPIFVFREWHRHRTQSYNELSARYTPMPNLNYVPPMERLLVNGGSNRQAGTAAGADELDENRAREWLGHLDQLYNTCEAIYQQGLRWGVPKELARLAVPVARYSRMRASANLRNWLAFLTLRMAPQAQWEIRQYANAVGDLIAERFPRTWELFAEGRRG